MKVAAIALALLLLPQEDDASKKAQQIDQALTWLLNEDSEVREMGRKRILEFGRDAIPAIEKKLAEKQALELVQILRHFDHSPGVDEAWIAEKELKDLEGDEQYKKEAERLNKDAIEKLMYVKYQEAMAHVRHKNYQRGFEMANALLALDGRSSHYDDYKRLRRHCENMITQTTLIEAKLLQPKVWYIDGESVELAARMKNLWKAPMTLTWEKGTEKEPGGGLLLLDVTVDMKGMGGETMSDQRHQDLRFEEEIPIAPGAQWETKFMLETSTAVRDEKTIRTITVGGWTQPAKVSTDGVNITRRIQFEPTVVKILPKKYERFLENPLHWLEKMIAEGDPNEIYVCSQLLDETTKDKGIEMLINLLAKSVTPISKNYAANILTGLTGVSNGTDARRWQNWVQARSTEPKDKKKK
jgi:hypothetical protein